jgi:hypothetical protein
MSSPLVNFFRYDQPLSRLGYYCWGVGLTALKFVVDWVIARWVFKQAWDPSFYLFVPAQSLGVRAISSHESWLFGTLVLAAIPFITVGVLLTVRRMLAAGVPLFLVFLFFIPVVNLLFFLVLCLLPTQLAVPQKSKLDDDEARWQRIRTAHRRITLDRKPGEVVVALGVTVPLMLGFVAFSTFGLENYGWGVFIGAPFCLGFFSVVLFGLNRPQSLGDCLKLAMTATTLVGLAMLLLAFEGAICLLMAAPLGYLLALIGALFGYAIQARPWQSSHAPGLLIAFTLALPALMAAESASVPEPQLIERRSAVVIDAPPEVVWNSVIAFPELPQPGEMIFKAGVAYPIRAEIAGKGPGAVRHCIFSTGVFVEPIDVWDEPNRLAFRVSEQPEPMTEWSPFNIHPPHLDNYLASRRGEFRLTRLPDGRTHLVGTTWYTNRMWPAGYWQLWSDAIIHRIHLRVLNHIKQVSESKGRRANQ